MLDIQKVVAARNTKWFGEEWRKTPPWYFGLALSGEVGEMNNFLKKEIRDNADVKGAVAEELADVLIYTLLMAEILGVDLEDEYHKKQNKNDEKFKGRKHGIIGVA